MVLVALLTLAIITTTSSPQAAPSFGVITGAVEYPSEYIPPMRIYAVSIDGKRHYRTSSRAGQSRFTIKKVAPGSYYVLAYTSEAPELAGGWTRAVECEIKSKYTATCPDHSLIPVTVVSGKTAARIKVSDWQNVGPGSFPPEPARKETPQPRQPPGP